MTSFAFAVLVDKKKIDDIKYQGHQQLHKTTVVSDIASGFEYSLDLSVAIDANEMEPNNEISLQDEGVEEILRDECSRRLRSLSVGSAVFTESDSILLSPANKSSSGGIQKVSEHGTYSSSVWTKDFLLSSCITIYSNGFYCFISPLLTFVVYYRGRSWRSYWNWMLQ